MLGTHRECYLLSGFLPLFYLCLPRPCSALNSRYHQPIKWVFQSVQYSSVAQSCPTLCDPMNRSTPGLPVHHQLPELPRLTSIESVMPFSHLILCHPLLLLPQSLPASESLPMSQLFAWGGRSTGVYISINSSNNVWTGRFGSTDQKQSLWTSLVSDYAQLNINIKNNGKRFSGLLDTGSGITIISKHLWPKSWPIQKISYQIAEMSQTKEPEVYQNIKIYPYEGPKGQPATLQPYVINAPLNRIKKDLLMLWQIQIYIPRFS